MSAILHPFQLTRREMLAAGIATLAVTNFHNEMLGLYRGSGRGSFSDTAPGPEIGRVTKTVTNATAMKTPVATKDLVERRDRPQTPCPLVQP